MAYDERGYLIPVSAKCLACGESTTATPRIVVPGGYVHSKQACAGQVLPLGGDLGAYQMSLEDAHA